MIKVKVLHRSFVDSFESELNRLLSDLQTQKSKKGNVPRYILKEIGILDIDSSFCAVITYIDQDDQHAN